MRTVCDDTGDSALAGVSPHGEAVLMEKTNPSMPAASPVFACNDDILRAVEALRKNGGVAKNHVDMMGKYVEEAKAECVPVLVYIGETGWFAVRQSTTLGRSAAGECNSCVLQ